MTDNRAILPPFIDATMMSTFRSCHQKFYNEFCLGLRPGDLSVHLHAGGCTSAALETFYRGFYEQGLDPNTAALRAYARFDESWGNFTTEKKTTKTRENTWAAIEKYLEKFPVESDPIQPFFFDGKTSVEFSFSIPLEPASRWGDKVGGDDNTFPLHPVTNEPWIYCGRFDMLGKHQGQVAFRDEKTTDRLMSNWSDQWNLRSQFLGYCWALQQSGLRCNKAVVRGIIIRAKDVDAIEAIKVYPQHLIDRWHEQLRRDLWKLTRCWQEQYFDFDLSESCSSYGGCAFMDLCTSKDTSAFHASYRIKRWNPLDRNPLASEPPETWPRRVRTAVGGIPFPEGSSLESAAIDAQHSTPRPPTPDSDVSASS